jgi:hypothetical protein
MDRLSNDRTHAMISFKQRLAAALVIGLAASTFSMAADAKSKKKESPSKALPEATQEQKDAYQRVYLGEYMCELQQPLSVTPHKTEGYVEVSFKRYKFTMKPVLSSTGAIRLEDVSGRTLMVQIANKSMLLDNKAGQRLVDECQHPQQKALADTPKAG